MNTVTSTLRSSQGAPSNTRGSRELAHMISLRREKVQDAARTPFSDHVLGELQAAFDAQCLVDYTGAAITDETGLVPRKLNCLKAGLYALRSIHTAWRNYPAVGGRLEGAPIGVVDFRSTAHSAVKENPEGQLGAQYARIMADAVGPPHDDFESAPHAQSRVNNCFLAIKKQFMIMFVQLAHEHLWGYVCDDEVLSEDETEPRTYTVQSTSAILPALHLMSAGGLVEAAEDKEDHNQDDLITGVTLKTMAEKYLDLATQVTRTRRAELDERIRRRDEHSAAKATGGSLKPEKVKPRARISRQPVVGSDDDDDDDDDDTMEVFVKRKNARKGASGKVKGGRKEALGMTGELVNEDNADEVGQPAQSPKCKSRKRSARVVDCDDFSNEATKPASKKRAKSTPATKKLASDSSSNQPESSNTSHEAPANNAVAPKIAKRGGAAPKWLQDEDDEVRQLIVDHPNWPMPKVYKEYSARVANTPYQREGQAAVEYRADFVEFPKGIIASDKERRKYDIAWRTYESVRQHMEKFKANVSSANSSPPYTWDPAQANLAAGLPKRAPPPRPGFFNNDAKTPVPRAPALPVAPIAPAMTAAPPAARLFSPIQYVGSVAQSSSATAVRARGRRPSGWNAVNQAPAAAASSPEPAEDKMEATKYSPLNDQFAPGDEQIASLEDFVAQQSDSSPS